jgi:hypothetical protein
MKELLAKHTRKARWGVIGMIVVTGIFLSLSVGDLEGYLMSWGATAFKALSGGLIGWFVSRYVVGLDLSAMDLEYRPMAGISQALLIGFYALALATGA